MGKLDDILDHIVYTESDLTRPLSETKQQIKHLMLEMIDEYGSADDGGLIEKVNEL
jgi:hypothetical protein